MLRVSDCGSALLIHDVGIVVRGKVSQNGGQIVESPGRVVFEYCSSSSRHYYFLDSERSEPS
jgi:hypothetical protein